MEATINDDNKAFCGTYASAGVDIDAGNALVERIKPLARSTSRAGVMGGLGGFGALFDMKSTGRRDPVLVSTTDGVGTKLKVAIETGLHDKVGVDLVAMCVNDLIVQGAEPLFFLDYFASGKLNVDTASRVIAGIADGCLQAGCALVGGETAEMPGMYAAGDYDLAGFAVGVAERDALLPQKNIKAGDAIIGVASNGLHSNGFSLVRKIVERAESEYSAPAPFDKSVSMGEALMAPTRIYVKPVLAAIAAGGVKALAHITGGGLTENLPRALPEGLGARIVPESWPVPPMFKWLARHGDVAGDEMIRTFNCGIGMAIIAAPEDADRVIKTLESGGEKAYVIGSLAPARSSPRVSCEKGWDWIC